jgi:hypothetical protein
MIKFFRKIRQKLLAESKMSKYLLYAFGEIVLVVIGILIALSVNNWNNDKQEKARIHDSYKSILNEINFVKSSVDKQILRNDSTIISLKNCLRVLRNKNDVAVKQFENNLGALVKLDNLSFDFPLTLGFLENVNQEKIANNEIGILLLNLKTQLSFLNGYQNYAITQYQNLIEPFVVKNINYSRIYNQDKLIQTSHFVDYSILIDNFELANILNLKLETDLTASVKLNELSSLIESLNNEIQKELLK